MRSHHFAGTTNQEDLLTPADLVNGNSGDPEELVLLSSRVTYPPKIVPAGGGWGSALQCLPVTHQALGSIPSTTVNQQTG